MTDKFEQMAREIASEIDNVLHGQRSEARFGKFSTLIATALEAAFKRGRDAGLEEAEGEVLKLHACFGTDEFSIGGDLHAQIIARMCADAVSAARRHVDPHAGVEMVPDRVRGEAR